MLFGWAELPCSRLALATGCGCEAESTPMPRYFFNVHDGRSSPDQEGTELPDIGTARAQAVGFSGEVLRDTGAKYWDHPDWRLDVLDEGGRTLFTLRFSAEGRADAP
jgi:hypothetical protein